MQSTLHYILLGNAALVVAFCCACLIEKLAIALNLRRAYKLRLHLALAAVSTSMLPVLLSPFTPLFSSLFSINGTDLVVAQYLKGNINLSAVQMSEALVTKNYILDTLFGGHSGISKLLLLIFCIAILLRTKYILKNVFRIRRHIKESAIRCRTRKVDIRISQTAIVPYSTKGLWRYHILIPESLITDPKAFRMALGHEAQHIRQGDVDWEILLTLISPLFVLNPIYWLLTSRIRRLREYTCDAIFLKKKNVDIRQYCLLLLEFASREAHLKSTSKTASHTAVVSLNGYDEKRGKKSTLRRRILALSQGADYLDRKSNNFINLIPATVLVLTVALIVLSAFKPSDWSHDRLMLSTVANLERLNTINGFGVPPLR